MVLVRKLLTALLGACLVTLATGCAEEEQKRDLNSALASLEKLTDEHGGRLATLENTARTLEAKLTAVEGQLGELSSQMGALSQKVSEATRPTDTGPLTATELAIVDAEGKGRIKLRVDDQDRARLILLDKEGGAKGDVDLAEVAVFARLLAEFRKDPAMGRFLDPANQ